MSLFKRGNVWWSYFYEDGIRHQSSTGTSNRRQAETIEAKLKEEVNNRRFQIVKTDPNMTFGELAARFIASGSRPPAPSLSPQVPAAVLLRTLPCCGSPSR